MLSVEQKKTEIILNILFYHHHHRLLYVLCIILGLSILNTPNSLTDTV